MNTCTHAHAPGCRRCGGPCGRTSASGPLSPLARCSRAAGEEDRAAEAVEVRPEVDRALLLEEDDDVPVFVCVVVVVCLC